MTITVNDDIIINVIEKGLSSLGESTKETIWHHLEKDFNYEKHKVPEKIEAFQQTLSEIFGTGYIFLDSLLREYLSEDTGADLSNFKSFAESVEKLRGKEPTEPTEIESPEEPFLSIDKQLPV